MGVGVARLRRSVFLVALIAVLAAVPSSAAPQALAPSGVEASGAPDLHQWRMNRHGFGRLKVGLNRAKMERRLGRSLKFAYNTGPCAIWTIRGVRGLSIMTTRGRLARVYAGMGTWRTSLGIQIGDSEATVRERYPRVRSRQHVYDPEGEYLIVPGPKRRVVFETNGDDQVTAFRGGRVPQVMYVEGCA